MDKKDEPRLPIIERAKSLEDEYVREMMDRDKLTGDWAGQKDEAELAQEERNFRKDYKVGSELVRTQERAHIQSLQSLLTPLIAHYAVFVRGALSERKAEMKFPKPFLSPNLDRLVNIVDSNTENTAANHLKLLENAMPTEELALYHSKDLESLAALVGHINRNAADITEENILQGGSKNELRTLAVLDKFLGLPSHAREKSRSAFLAQFSIRRSAYVLWGRAYAKKEERKSPFGHLSVLPVGEYGADFSKRLFRTMQIMLSLCSKVDTEAKQMAEQNPELFHKTARGREDHRNGPSHSLQEGILSLFQSVYLLTAEKLDGYENPDKLLQDIIEVDLLEQLAYSTPAATIGPLALMGHYIHGILQKDVSGTLVLNPEVKTRFLERKKDFFLEKIRQWSNSDEYNPSLPASGRGCPVSFESKTLPISGVNQLSRIMLDVFKNVKS